MRALVRYTLQQAHGQEPMAYLKAEQYERMADREFFTSSRLFFQNTIHGGMVMSKLLWATIAERQTKLPFTSLKTAP